MDAGNSDTGNLVLPAGGAHIHLHIVGSMAGVVFALGLLKEDFLLGANQRLAVGKVHFLRHGDGATAALFLGGIAQLTGHFVRRRAGATGIGENVHIRKGAFLDKGKALGKFLLGFTGEGHNHIRGDGAAWEEFSQQRDTFIISGGVVFALHPRQNGIAATLHG